MRWAKSVNGGADLDQTYSNQASALTLFSRQQNDDHDDDLDDDHDDDHDCGDDDHDCGDDNDDDHDDDCIHFGGHESFLMAHL